jgi:imidazolonepropionase-like amidohydrolase
MRLPTFLLVFAAAVTRLDGQPVSPPAQQPETVIHAGSLLDRPGKEPRRNATVVIQNGKITAVQDGFTKPAAGATVIDLRDRFV